MSHWTHVIGAIEVDTFGRSDAEAMYLAQTVVNHLPQVTGSEGPVEYHLAKPNWNNTSSSSDEFGQLSNLGIQEYRSYLKRTVTHFEYQSRVLILVNGDLRDRELSETVREITKMLTRLGSRLWVQKCCISVSDYDGTFVFNNPEWVQQLELTDWAQDLVWHYTREESKGCGHRWISCWTC